MSSTTDHPEGPSTLPEPELNPLLNPVLGQNMGRWAEAYFTAPPEKREQAVLELLHELQRETPAPESIALTSPASAQEEAPEPVFEPASGSPQASATSIRCHACGRENPASHRFCGMCGTPVAAQSAEDDLPTAENPQQSEPALPQNNESPFARSTDAVYEPALSTNELSLFQAGRETTYRREGSDNEDEIFSYSPASRSYRVYVGIALAIVIFALAYMAWRGAQATSQSSHLEPQAPPAVTQPAVPAPTPPSTPPSTSTSKTDPSEGTPPANEQATVPSDSGRTQFESGQVEPTVKASKDKLAHATPPTAPVVETKPSEVSVAGNGDEELAMAQRYLAGGDGLQRNSAEAAKWLWKSLAKQNANATLLLADLYLKGDGVSKNCDQARVLLDSAARSGMKQAGERLRHLQAFGCE